MSGQSGSTNFLIFMINSFAAATSSSEHKLFRRNSGCQNINKKSLNQGSNVHNSYYGVWTIKLSWSNKKIYIVPWSPKSESKDTIVVLFN